MRRLTIASCILLALSGSALADLRIDNDDPVRKRPSPPPPTEPTAKGCRSEQAPEWVFGLGVLALGGWGLRRQRRAAASP